MFLTAPSQQSKQLKSVEELARLKKHTVADSIGQKFQETEIIHIQHRPNIIAAMSSKYLQPLDITERFPLTKSFRSLEYAKTRPMLTVEEYQKKNRKFKEKMERNKPTKMVSSYWHKEIT